MYEQTFADYMQFRESIKHTFRNIHVMLHDIIVETQDTQNTTLYKTCMFFFK